MTSVRLAFYCAVDPKESSRLDAEGGKSNGDAKQQGRWPPDNSDTAQNTRRDQGYQAKILVTPNPGTIAVGSLKMNRKLLTENSS